MASWELRPPNASSVWVERDTFILCFAYKWAHEKKTRCLSLPDYPLYKKNKLSDKALAADIWTLLDEADYVIAHNGDRFDIPRINSCLAVHGHKRPSPYKSIDTIKMARRVFKFDSARLDNLGRYLGEGRKIPNTGAALWRGCVNGDMKSWRTMAKYNVQDVVLLERVYHRLKAWSPTHPDLSPEGGCPTCMSHSVQARGFVVSRTNRKQRFHCQDCGAWFLGKAMKKG